MKRKIIYALIFLLALVLIGDSLKRDANLFSRDGVSMNTVIRIAAKSNSREPVDAAFNLLEKLDQSLSMYDKNSDLTQINSMAGVKAINFQNEFIAEITERARKIYYMTDGTFNPLIGSLTKLWKINQNDNTMPDIKSIDQALKLTDINNLVVNSDSVFLKMPGAALDFGGIAKGYASEKIADLFKNYGVESGLIDLGGNIFVIGKNNGKSWQIGIRDPISPNNPPAIIIAAEDTAVITSGNYERYKIIDGVKYSHFFNPADGMPVKNDLLSVTVITPDATAADALATAFMITGIERAKKIIPENFGVIFIREGIEINASMNLKNKIVRSNYPVNFF